MQHTSGTTTDLESVPAPPPAEKKSRTYIYIYTYTDIDIDTMLTHAYIQRYRYIDT